MKFTLILAALATVSMANPTFWKWKFPNKHDNCEPKTVTEHITEYKTVYVRSTCNTHMSSTVRML
jgi:cbb3-type cytochrome oxidase cytochrome c subunit